MTIDNDGKSGDGHIALPIRVRPAGAADRDGIAALLGRAPGDSDGLLRPDLTLLVARAHAGVVGAVAVRERPVGEAFSVELLVVDPAHRGRKVGRRLLAAAVEWSRQRHAAQVEVRVRDVDAGALLLCRSFGFAPSADRLVLAA